MADQEVSRPERGAQSLSVRPESMGIACAGCQVVFSGRKSRRFCSLKCYNATQMAGAKVAACEACGTVFRPKRPSSRAAAGLVANGRFCSNACYRNNRAKPDAGPKPICSECGGRCPRRGAMTCSAACRKARATREAKKKAAALSGVAERVCAVCAAAYVTGYGDKRRSYCSDECRLRKARRIRRSYERARLRSVLVERVDPDLVFKRDGWLCYLCGKKTRIDLRGTAHPKAPELDHIIPLSKGGEHSYRNTACACRSCNWRKRDKILGQPSLLLCSPA